MDDLKNKFENAIISLRRVKTLSNEFDILFDDEENIEVLRSSASNFFGLLYHEMQDSMIILLCKLTDPAGKNGNKNLSAEHFLTIDEIKNSESYEIINNIYEKKVKPAREKINKYRNKYAVHSDYTTVIELAGNKPSYKDIRELLQAVEEFFSAISIRILNIHRVFGGIAPLKNGAGYLLTLIKKAQKNQIEPT
jgi:hypothetical protein